MVFDMEAQRGIDLNHLDICHLPQELRVALRRVAVGRIQGDLPADRWKVHGVRLLTAVVKPGRCFTEKRPCLRKCLGFPDKNKKIRCLMQLSFDEAFEHLMLF